MDRIRCRYCLKVPLDAWYIYDKFQHKHLWIKCTCSSVPFPITLINGLDIPIRPTKQQKKQLARDAQPSLL